MNIVRNSLVAISILIINVSATAQKVTIEYIAHASFIIESEAGTRVLFDPYHSYNQMGYTFPDTIKTDFILITHPHFDHDASKYLSENTPVYREAGEYQFRDIKFTGIASRHAGADRIAPSGQQVYNTIWIVEVNGISIAHLGDNGVPSENELKLLSDVDYIIGQPTDEYYKLFGSKTYIPNHYLLPEITKHTNWMQPIDGWLKDKDNVRKLENNKYEFPNKESKPSILVFKPSPLVKEWSQDYYDALASLTEGFGKYRESRNADEAIPYLDKAIALAPYVMQVYLNKAIILNVNKDHEGIISILEKGLANVPDIDWAREVRVHKMLADAYVAIDQPKSAYNHYLWLTRNDRIVDKKTLENAKEFITKYTVE